MLTRCSWCLGSQLYQDYHDRQWGVPVHDETQHFEFLLLEAMQAGLSWITILKKRQNFAAAFANFNPVKVANYNQADIDRLLNDAGIIRNRKKIEAAIINAQQFLQINQQIGFDNYIWSFTDNQVIQNNWQTRAEVPTTTELARLISKDLKKRGFKFVGEITIYSYLQAIGVVNDHLISCFRHKQLAIK
jgi:DNA-3-methyladenine glycosylase I